MKTAVLGCCLAFLLGNSSLRADSLLQPNDRLAICGYDFSIYLEGYLLATQPTPGLDVAQFGWSARDPGGLLNRLNTDLLPFKPTVVLTCLGGDANTYAKAQTDLVEALKKAGVRTIVMGSPEFARLADYPNEPAKLDPENKNREALADIAKDVAVKEGVIYADVYGATMAADARIKAKHAENCVPGTVMGEARSLVAASAFLKALGCDGNVGTITVDYGAGKAETDPAQKVISYQDGTLKIESTRYPFWFPGHGVGGKDPSPFPIMKILSFNQDLNRYRLVVKNLPTAQAKVYWKDGQLDYSSDELARGINLPAEFPRGALADCYSGVDNGVRGQQGQEGKSGSALIHGKPDPQADAKREEALQIAKSRVVPVQTTIKIQPLAAVEKQPPGPIPIIIDTDLDSDVDDVGALALLNDFMDQGEATLLACIHNTRNNQQSSCATIQAINAYYGHPSIPIGQYYGEPDAAAHVKSVLTPAPPEGYHGPAQSSGSSYTLQVHQKFDPEFPNDDKLPAGVDVYRKALAAAADDSVVIVSVGLMENLQDLIQSQPDAVSPLNGMDLVRKKVRLMVNMANTVPQDVYLLRVWPTKILWTTDVGSYIGTGPSLQATPESNPVRFAYGHFGDARHNALRDGRQSWDLTAAWLGVRGPGNLWDVLPGRREPYIDKVTNSPVVPHPNEFSVTIKMPSNEVAKIIGTELARPPKNSP